MSRLLATLLLPGLLLAALAPASPRAAALPGTQLAAAMPHPQAQDAGSAPRAASAPRWRWPVAAPQVLHEFRAPDHSYGPGHRGLDLLLDVGETVFAPAQGVVRFRGRVVDRGVLTIEHAGGYRSSYEPIDSTLMAGQLVRAGEPIGVRGAETGHCPRCLHLGVRLGDDYLNPRLLLGGLLPSVLKPWNG